MSIVNIPNFGQFWSVSWSITNRFRVLERFPRLTIPGVRLHVRRQLTHLWPIVTRFEDYYTPFGGPKSISIVVEPQGALMFQSSTIAVCCRFWSVSCTITHSFWVLEQFFTIDEPRATFTCRSSTLTILAGSGSFRALLLTSLGS